jgi:PST family polysaccharide transporter
MSSIHCDELQEEILASPPVAAKTAESGKGTYAQILKSSALVGGSSALNIVIGIVRTKAMAILLGPAGFGLFGIYNSIVNLTQTVAGMGVNSSGVRQIAAAAGSKDEFCIAQTAIVLRRVSILLGLIGALLLIIFARPISSVTFGDHQHITPVAILSVAVLLMLLSAGQSALIQGMRRIADLARMNVLGALFGTMLSIPVVYYLRDRGVVPALIIVAGMTLLTSWWYSRKIEIQAASVSMQEATREVAALLKLGLAFMSSGLMTMGVAYVVRITVLREVGYEATGLYQSAWTLGGLYVGFILQAMGADFYPRLTAVAADDAACNRLVNEQARVGLLLAGPGVIATLTFAPLVLSLFYSAKFTAAVPVLRWICLGTVLQVITWPMGFIIIAKAKQAIYFWCETAWAIASLALAWGCVTKFGLTGAGIAFFGSYVFHGVLIYFVVHRLSGFEWSSGNKNAGVVFIGLVAAVFSLFYVLPLLPAVMIGAVALLISTVYSIRTLTTLVSVDQIPRPFQRILSKVGLLHSAHMPSSHL